MKHLVAFVMGLGAVCAVPGTAGAQSTRRPDLNEFSRGLRDPGQSLAVRGNLGASFYDRLTVQVGPDGFVPPDHGWGSFASAGLMYNVRIGNVALDGTIGTSASYYPAEAQPFRWKAYPAAGASAVWSWNVTDNTVVDFGTALAVRPIFSETFFSAGFGNGGDPNSAFLPPQAAFVDGSYLTFRPSISVRHTISRRWSVSAGYDYERREGLNLEPDQGWVESAAYQYTRANVHYAVTRNLSVRGGYRYEDSVIYDTGERYQVQGLDLGVDYGRGVVLQLARRTTLTMNGRVNAYVDQNGAQHYTLGGDVALVHEFQRTWSSSVNYGRGIDSSQILFSEPVLTDTLNAHLNGNLSRTVGAHASASVQGGALAFGSGARTFNSSANTGLQFSLGRHIAVGADYTYYRYRYDEEIVLPTGVPSVSASQGIYVFLSMWAPIYQRGGRNAAR